jgi:predicted GNAT family N-acyltransferase
MRTRLSETDMRKLELQDAQKTAYEPVAHLNRKDRRTSLGRVMVAEAQAKALKTENEILRAALDVYESNNQ